MSCPWCSCYPCVCKPTVLTPLTIAHTFAECLKNTVDCVRDIPSQMGLRPYTVWLVWTKWTGGQKGYGNETIFAEKQILPTPKVTTVASLGANPEMIGQIEKGDIQICEISGKLHEDTLQGNDVVVPLGVAMPRDVDFFWEVRLLEANVTGRRRRFTLTSAPMLDASGVQWRVKLTKQYGDLDRQGGLG